MADFGHRSCGIADHPSGYLFAEGCDRVLLIPVDADYRIQSCPSEQIADTLAGRDQLKFATAIPGRDSKSNQDTEAPTIDIMHPVQVNNNSWASG